MKFSITVIPDLWITVIENFMNLKPFFLDLPLNTLSKSEVSPKINAYVYYLRGAYPQVVLIIIIIIVTCSLILDTH